jgi:hypothetical protein
MTCRSLSWNSMFGTDIYLIELQAICVSGIGISNHQSTKHDSIDSGERVQCPIHLPCRHNCNDQFSLRIRIPDAKVKRIRVLNNLQNLGVSDLTLISLRAPIKLINFFKINRLHSTFCPPPTPQAALPPPQTVLSVTGAG